MYSLIILNVFFLFLNLAIIILKSMEGKPKNIIVKGIIVIFVALLSYLEYSKYAFPYFSIFLYFIDFVCVYLFVLNLRIVQRSRGIKVTPLP